MLGFESRLIQRVVDEKMALMHLRVAAMVKHALHDVALAVEKLRMRPSGEAAGEVIVVDLDVS